MSNFGNALLFLIDAVFSLYISILLMRYILQVVRADFYNPLSQFVWEVTRPPVSLLQRVIPRWRNHDLAALLLALVLAMINLQIDLVARGFSAGPLLLLGLALVHLVRLACYLYCFSLVVQAVMSWVNPGAPTPVGALLWSINEPLLRPVRNVLPPISGIDLSPLVLIIALQMLLRLLPGAGPML
jgi:YggT family protein